MPPLHKPAYLSDDEENEAVAETTKSKSYKMKYLNNLGYSDESIAEVKAYISSGYKTIPKRLENEFGHGWIYNTQVTRFKQKWKDFIVENGHLVFEPTHLIVIPENEKESILQEMYDDLTKGVGAGIRIFYHHIVNKYLNIRRIDVEHFLKNQKTFQLTRPIRHLINKPVLATKPNERWCIDLVEMKRYADNNDGYLYILTCIDYFSRFVWATSLKRKLAEDVVDGMDRIVTEARGVYPEIIMADNGGEFQGALNTWCRNHDIKKIKTQSYTPQSNGLIENFNGQLRKMLREIMIRNNSLNWIDYLQTCCDNRNSQQNSTIRARPCDVWQPTHDVPANDTVAANIRKKAKDQVAKNKTKELEVGQLVRVKMSALYSQVRKVIKAGKGDAKYLAVKYSPEIFRIAKILKPDHDGGYEKLRYYLEDLDGNEKVTQLKRNNPNKRRERQRFFATDLQPADWDIVTTEKKKVWRTSRYQSVPKRETKVIPKGTSSDVSAVRSKNDDGFNMARAHFLNRIATGEPQKRAEKRKQRQQRETTTTPRPRPAEIEPERLQEVAQRLQEAGDDTRAVAKAWGDMTYDEQDAHTIATGRTTRSRTTKGRGVIIGGVVHEW